MYKVFSVEDTHMESDYTVVHDRGSVPKFSVVCIFSLMQVQWAWFHVDGPTGPDLSEGSEPDREERNVSGYWKCLRRD